MKSCLHARRHALIGQTALWSRSCGPSILLGLQVKRCTERKQYDYSSLLSVWFRNALRAKPASCLWSIAGLPYGQVNTIRPEGEKLDPKKDSKLYGAGLFNSMLPNSMLPNQTIQTSREHTALFVR